MQGQANHFYRLAKERIPYPTQRYVGETERLFGVLDARLAKTNAYLVGSTYSIADIANFGWVNVAYFAGVNLDDFPHLYKWWEKIAARPAVKRGLAVPSPPGITNEPFKEKMKTDEEFRSKNEELQELLKQAKEQYGYKYASP
jgi:glutathione S-transferase